MRRTFGASTLRLVLGDITRERADAIVNAANSRLAAGAGVDGAIHAAGGPAIVQETAARYPEGCPTGSAVVSTAGNLPARFVIHAVGPIWQGGHKGEPELLCGAYRKSLDLAVELGCRSIAFPALSTGVFGYPLDLAASAALTTVSDFLIRHSGELDVRFVLNGEGAYGAFARVLDEIAGDRD